VNRGGLIVLPTEVLRAPGVREEPQLEAVGHDPPRRGGELRLCDQTGSVCCQEAARVDAVALDVASPVHAGGCCMELVLHIFVLVQDMRERATVAFDDPVKAPVLAENTVAHPSIRAGGRAVDGVVCTCVRRDQFRVSYACVMKSRDIAILVGRWIEERECVCGGGGEGGETQAHMAELTLALSISCSGTM
jgi:hypothetical protein